MTFRAHCLAIAVLALANTTLIGAEGPVIRLAPASDKQAARIEITNLGKNALDACRKLEPAATNWDSFLKVQVVVDGKVVADRPSLLGNWRVDGEVLRFDPRFSFEKGITYRVTLSPSRLSGATQADERPITADLSIPKPAANPTTVVSAIYPSADKLPENQLKFYVHFSAPMQRGDSYKHVELLNENGKPVVQPFVEIEQEYWDRRQQRLTLLIDPGRIKRGLKPREDLGPVLEEGKKYTLVIKTTWVDAEGQPLKAEHRKSFRAGPPEEGGLDPSQWKFIPPVATESVVGLRFPKPMEHSLVSRCITVLDSAGKEVEGEVTVSDNEKLWQFAPAKPWKTGKYRLHVDTILEDLAGNGIGRPFEVDITRPAPKNLENKPVILPFVIRPPEPKP